MSFMSTNIPLLSILVWLIVGVACGWLESERVQTPLNRRWINFLLGAAGAVAAGLFFLKWGELVPRSPFLAPLVSGLVGAGISLSISGTVYAMIRRFS